MMVALAEIAMAMTTGSSSAKYFIFPLVGDLIIEPWALG
jgi:hypothetical protein